MVTGAREVHLVGSVPLASAEEVFRTTAGILGERLRKLPDGETGPRKNWINFQYGVLARHPAFEPTVAIDPDALALEGEGRGADYTFTPVRVRQGASLADVQLGDLGYAASAIASYRLFDELKRAGVIHGGARFQVSLPTPLAPVGAFVVPEHFGAVYPVYLRALMGELDRILAAVPHEELAVQWDVALEFALWEGVFPPPPGDWRAMLLGQLGQLGDHVPAGVALGYHLCYGDRGHKHFIEPRDAGNLVEVANGIAARVRRPLDWIHLPVPRSRDDEAYFAPLAGLALAPGTKLFLGVVHLTDGVQGARRRIAAAERFVTGFGIGTECGLGRRPPSTIPDLLRLHAELA